LARARPAHCLALAMACTSACRTHHSLDTELHGAALVDCGVCWLPGDDRGLHQQALAHRDLATPRLLHASAATPQGAHTRLVRDPSAGHAVATQPPNCSERSGIKLA
jgi:hypothetical protein